MPRPSRRQLKQAEIRRLKGPLRQEIFNKMLAAYGGPLDDANAIVRGLKRKPVIPHESSSEILDRIADWQELSICMGENDFSQEEKAEINSKIEKEINDFSAALTVERLIQGIGDGNSALFRDIADELEEPEGPRKRNDFLALKAFSQLPEPRTFRDWKKCYLKAEFPDHEKTNAWLTAPDDPSLRRLARKLGIKFSGKPGRPKKQGPK